MIFPPGMFFMFPYDDEIRTQIASNVGRLIADLYLPPSLDHWFEVYPALGLGQLELEDCKGCGASCCHDGSWVGLTH